MAGHGITNSAPISGDAVRPPALEDAVDVVERAIPRVTALLRGACDGTQRVPHLEWTIAETAAHLWSVVQIYAGFPEGSRHPWRDVDSRAQTSAAIISDIDERDPAALAALIERDAPPMIAAFRSHGARPITYIFEKPASTATALAGLAGEFLIHGWDLARTVGVRWPIASADAVLVTRASCAVLPMFVAPGAANFEGVYEVCLRGGPVITMAFNRGRLTFTEGRVPRPDCRISANPSAFLLCAYGRLGLWSPVLTLRLLAGGRKPWLALRLRSLLRQP